MGSKGKRGSVKALQPLLGSGEFSVVKVVTWDLDECRRR